MSTITTHTPPPVERMFTLELNEDELTAVTAWLGKAKGKACDETYGV